MCLVEFSCAFCVIDHVQIQLDGIALLCKVQDILSCLDNQGCDVVNVCDGIRCELRFVLKVGSCEMLPRNNNRCSQGWFLSSTIKEKIRLFLALKSLFM